MPPRGASASSAAKVHVTTPAIQSDGSPFVLSSEIHHRLLAWIDDSDDPIGGWAYPRYTTEGLAAHLTDDWATTNPLKVRETGEVLTDDGTYTPEIVDALLNDLENEGLVKHSNGEWHRTAKGTKALGGIVYADHADRKTDAAHAAYWKGD